MAGLHRRRARRPRLRRHRPRCPGQHGPQRARARYSTARQSGYVGLSRGRADNRLYPVEGEGRVDVGLAMPAPAPRQAYAQAARTLGSLQAKHLALDTSDLGQAADALHAELDGAARLLRARPPADVARLPMLQGERSRLSEQVSSAQARLVGLEERLNGLRRRSPGRP